MLSHKKAITGAVFALMVGLYPLAARAEILSFLILVEVDKPDGSTEMLDNFRGISSPNCKVASADWVGFGRIVVGMQCDQSLDPSVALQRIGGVEGIQRATIFSVFK
jgi:hypothetical protein